MGWSPSMAILSFPQASYVCSQFSRSGKVGQSFRRTYETQPEGRSWTEGRPGFAEFRDASLREAERLLFLAISQYRRAFDLAVPSASPWCHVTLYYSTMFAAKALLGMFGAWRVENGVLEAITGNPGAQHFSILRTARRGPASHQAFWVYFYSEAIALTMLVEPNLRFALQPVNGDVHWMTRRRNDYNYDSALAFDVIRDTQKALPARPFPTCFAGDTQIQLRHATALLRIATDLAAQLGLATDALDDIEPGGARSAMLSAAIKDAVPRDLRANLSMDVFKF